MSLVNSCKEIYTSLLVPSANRILISYISEIEKICPVEGKTSFDKLVNLVLKTSMLPSQIMALLGEIYEVNFQDKLDFLIGSYMKDDDSFESKLTALLEEKSYSLKNQYLVIWLIEKKKYVPIEGETNLEKLVNLYTQYKKLPIDILLSERE